MVTTVLVLGVIHPSTTTSASGVSPTTTASTTAGIHSGSTTTTGIHSGSTTTTIAHAGSTTTTTSPSRVPVLVANASGVPGAAAAVTTELQTGGWSLLPPVNASSHLTASQVYYLAGQQKSANTIATSLHLPASAVVPYTTSAPISSIGMAEVVVVVGPELAASSKTSTGTSTTVN